jgi:hypothetical protein
MLDQNADKFVAEMKGENVAVPKVGQAITDWAFGGTRSAGALSV